MLLHTPQAVSLVTVTLLTVAAIAYTTIQAITNITPSSPAERQCTDLGIDAELAPKCEHPFS